VAKATIKQHSNGTSKLVPFPVLLFAVFYSQYSEPENRNGPAPASTPSRNNFSEIISRIVHTQTVPRRSTKPNSKTKPQPAPAQKESEQLKGWQQIASFLGQPVSVAQRWAHQGMPVKREGRFVTTSPVELNRWLGRESGEPVHVATPETDLSAELKRGLAHVRQERPPKKRGKR
jgi:hypothetical protein